MANRKRSVPIVFWVTEGERELIHQKMELLGIVNMSAYLRKMAIDGYAVRLDIPELKEMLSLLRYSSNNLNQLTKRVHETRRLYDADITDIRQSQDRILEATSEIVKKLAGLK